MKGADMKTVTTIEPMAALNRLLEIATAFSVSQTFFTACNLGVFEVLSNEPATAEDLAQRVGIHPLGCRRLLMALKELGLVERDQDLYRNSELGNFCTSKSTVLLEPLSMWGAPFYHMWEFLPDALRELSPRWQQALGTRAEEVFAALYEDPARLRRFTEFVNAFGIPQGRVIAERIDFAPYHCVLDVAGGPGGIAIQIGLKHPHLRGIIMDLPPVCAIAQEHIQRSGLVDRFTTAPADLFKGPYPQGSDVIILGYILHDWNDTQCHTILRHCFTALPPQGLLLIAEKVLNNDFSGTRVGLMMDLHMLVVSDGGARERSEAEYRALLEQTGFRDVDVIRLDAPRDLIVARKAQGTQS
jgi:hypothetical protein